MGKPLTRDFLLSRGYCCGMGCLNCPYGDTDLKNGKGDSFRPVNREQFESNYDDIDWGREGNSKGRPVGYRDISSERLERKDPPKSKEP
jgi:hypothetical protein